jgi:thioredoxin 1
MSFAPDYLDQEPTRATVDATTGLTLLEFGAPDCGFCRAIQPAIERALADSDAAHLKIEDGAGRPLGRSFGVKLWPTLIAVRDGVEVGRLVRPGREAEIRALLETR